MNFLQEHKDTLEVVTVGGGGFTVMLTEAELGLKCLVAVATLGFIIYKWYKEYKKK